MAPDRLPYFPFYPQDFMGDGKVQMMNATERGIYISLLCHEWSEGAIPDDPGRLARVCGTDPETMKEAWPQVRRCFKETDDDRLVQARLEEEREKARRKSEQARQAAEARWSDDADGGAPASASADANGDADAHPDGGAGRNANQNQSQKEETATEGEGSSLRSSPSPPQGGNDGRPDQEDDESFDPATWLERVQDTDSPLASDALPAGIYPLLWRAEDPPPDAPEDWSIRADIKLLDTLVSKGWSPREVALAMIGLRLLGDEGEIPDRLTAGYPTRSREWEGRELWQQARQRGRDWLDGQSDPSETLDALEEEGIDLSDIRGEEVGDGR